MGTNYYLHQKPECACCGRPFEPLHIGKSSGGWCFSLHVMPEDNINTLGNWVELWSKDGACIRNEYGDTITPNEMLLVISARHWGGEKEWEDSTWPGYESEQAFHRSNQSERGPNGLLRHKKGDRCIGHGEGTWDFLVGDFS